MIWKLVLGMYSAHSTKLTVCSGYIHGILADAGKTIHSEVLLKKNIGNNNMKLASNNLDSLCCI